MGYLHINNLYKDQRILAFRECFAMEKIHGTSAHISFKTNPSNPSQTQLIFFSGGEKHDRFVALFNKDALKAQFEKMFSDKDVVVYGEAYGGSQQKMSETYGKDLKFIAFDVLVASMWLSVPDAEQVCQKLGIEFVHYKKVSTDLAALDAEKNADSVQAIRNGVGPGKMREGVVLRPPFEVRLNDGSRIIAKHKRDEFRETASPRVVTPEKQKLLEEASAIANEWVTEERLRHVLDKIPDHKIEMMGTIIAAMQEDVVREGAGEIVDSPQARKAIATKTALMYKAMLQRKLVECNR